METRDIIIAQQTANDVTLPDRTREWAWRVRDLLLVAADPLQVWAFNAWLLGHSMPRVVVHNGKVLTEQSRNLNV